MWEIKHSGQATVGSLLAQQARIRPEEIAVEFNDLCRSFAVLNERVNRLANALVECGVERGDRLAVLSENRLEYVEIYFAASKIGAIVCALNWRLRNIELGHCIKLTEPKIIFVSPKYEENANFPGAGSDLKIVLGDHVQQKGSRVSSDNLRFDFSHFSKLDSDQLNEIENFVNSRIEGKLELEENRNVPIDKAISDGAIALFDEKYDDTVRTIKFGNSYELCGGTHVKNTSEIWQFKIKSEGAIASGIRRVEAITFDSVKEYYSDKENEYVRTKKLLNNSGDIVKSLTDLLDENERLRKEMDQFLKEKTDLIKHSIKSEIIDKDGVKFISKTVSLNPSSMKDLIFSLGNELEDLFAILISEFNSKIYISCYISKNLVESKGLDAREVINELSKHVKANGGGQPFYATAGGDYQKGLNKLSEESQNYHNKI